MKKIDLHTHTISTVSDSDFEFSLLKVKEYVEKLEIDAIAIINLIQDNILRFRIVYQLQFFLGLK